MRRLFYLFIALYNILDDFVLILAIAFIFYLIGKHTLKKQNKPNNKPNDRAKNKLEDKTQSTTTAYERIEENLNQLKDLISRNNYDEATPHNYNQSNMPYKKVKILTPTEQAFYYKLVPLALKHKLFVCPKVRLEDIAHVSGTKQVKKYRNYIKSRHIDFLLINSKYETVAAIELDDPSHNNPNAIKNDEFKNQLFATIGVPLIRIWVGTDYTTQIITAFSKLNIL